MHTHALALYLVHDQSIGQRVCAIISSFTCRIIASVQCIYWDQLMLALLLAAIICLFHFHAVIDTAAQQKQA